MNVRRDGDVFIAEDGGTVLGSARATDAGVVLELADPHEAVALALVHAVAAAQPESDERPVLAPSFGSVHLQTDDQNGIVQLVERLVPRVFRSRETAVSPARNGWVAVYNEVADRDPRRLERLGRELSNAVGFVTFTIGVEDGLAVHYIAFERGRLLDEYMSVPEFRGPLAPGDAIAMRANPTVIGRLTGAEPGAIRRVARTADSPVDLPPAEELLAELAEVLGLHGVEYGFETARDLEGAVVVEHE
ncbi:MAG TPA: hypothetical protein VGW30_00855 [Gaiellaceae bacterium]|nr:hypothetical protein [Gaiellaceae bacterium]